jgi:hypothetical protein
MPPDGAIARAPPHVPYTSGRALGGSEPQRANPIGEDRKRMGFVIVCDVSAARRRCRRRYPPPLPAAAACRRCHLLCACSSLRGRRYVML